jgi:peptidoglycan hydrolase CwlO-like protein
MPAESAGGSGAAFDATVQVGPPEAEDVSAARRREHETQLQREIEAIQGKIDSFREALASKKAELKQVRAEGKE